MRVWRGGSYAMMWPLCTSATRGFSLSYLPPLQQGFRVVRVPKESSRILETPESPPASSPAAVTLPAPLGLPEDYENFIGMQFKLIRNGEFMMGSSEGDPDTRSEETPQHLVCLTKPYCFGVYEVTQTQFERVMDVNPSQSKNAHCPVDSVSWDEAMTFCQKLSELDVHFNYRLPTEAEWEYACRAGTMTRYSCGNDLDARAAWTKRNSDREAHPVGQMRPNPWGLYDMHGNVHEWCLDHWKDGYGDSSPQDDPNGPPAGTEHVFRGGSFAHDFKTCRSASRRHAALDYQGATIGFRVVLVPAE